MSGGHNAINYLQRELRDMRENPIYNCRCEVSERDVFTWTVWFVGPSDSPYAGGCYKAELKFPSDYPYKPPVMRLISAFWHPNVHKPNDSEGKNNIVCMSILHKPGDDPMNPDEHALLRWSPINNISTVLKSFLLLLSEPDQKEGAPANVDALKEYREDIDAFRARCKRNAQKSVEELPPDFVWPKTLVELELSKWEKEIAYLREMGITNPDDELYQLCEKYGGDVDQITNLLMC